MILFMSNLKLTRFDRRQIMAEEIAIGYDLARAMPGVNLGVIESARPSG